MRAIGLTPLGTLQRFRVSSCQPIPTRLPTMRMRNTISMSLIARLLHQVRKQRYFPFAWHSSRPLGNQLIQLFLQPTEHSVITEVANLHAFLLEVASRR